MNKVPAIGSLFALIATVAVAQQEPPSDATIFAKKVAASNAFEIESSKLANERAERGEVKSFAKQMIDDHSKAGEDLKAAVKSGNIPPPVDQPDAKQQQTISRLQQTRGKTFDDQYISAQREGHREAVTLFKNYSAQGKSAPLKDFAQKTLPKIEHHLQRAEELSQQIRTSQRQEPAERAQSDKAGKQPPRAREERTAQRAERQTRERTEQPRRRLTKASKKKRYAKRHRSKYARHGRRHRYAHHRVRHVHARKHRAHAYRAHRGYRSCWCPCTYYRW
jgi:putative membrane protein